ncbi:MAG: Rieske (2Fe-2S) protein [Pseudomonadota bacterium]
MPDMTDHAYLRLAGAPPVGTPLCRLDALSSDGAKGFLFGEDVRRFDMFVVWRNGRLNAYVNDCPHAHTPLDYIPDRFFNLEKSHLLCGTHGALFRIEDGYCVAGPCKGRRLIPVPVHLDGDMICIG